MALSNGQIAAELKTRARTFGRDGDNPYKGRAYRRAAEVVAALAESVEEAVKAGADLTVHPGIGKGISAALREIVAAGRISDEATAETAAFAGVMLYDAVAIADAVAAFLRQRCGAERAEPAGEVRRRCEIVQELVVVVATADFAATAQAFSRFAGGTAIVSRQSRRAEFRLASGLPVTLQEADTAGWGLALVWATGSDRHLAELKRRRPALTARGPAAADEAAVFRRLGLQEIPPELREGQGEVALAARKRLPQLVSAADLRGDLHLHTVASDGTATIEEMAAAARTLGHEYLGITDHSQSLKIAGGVTEAALWKQIRRIDRLNARGRIGLRLLKSAEVDILADGRLDYPDELLRELDYTVCSIHSRFRLNREQQTERLLRAMDHPSFGILGHATGRLLLRRPGYEFDWERVARHARDRGCWFEINCSPDRLDLSAEHARFVANFGIRIAICTDAHRPEELAWLPWGVGQARRAGLTADAVLNSRTAAELERLFRR